VRVPPKTIGIVAVTHNPMSRDPRRLNDKLTLSFDLRQARRIRSHFQIISIYDRKITEKKQAAALHFDDINS